MQFLRGVIAILAKLFRSLDDLGSWPCSKSPRADRPVFLWQIQTVFGGFAKIAASTLREMFVVRSFPGCESLCRIYQLAILQNVERRTISRLGFALTPIP